jgi:hypothetical protein
MIAHDRSWLEVLIGPYRRTLQRTGRGLDAEGSANETFGQPDNKPVPFLVILVYIKI